MRNPIHIDYARFKEVFQEVLSGNFTRRENIQRLYPFIFMMVGLFCVYIYNGYQAQRQQVKLAQINKEITNAQFEYLSISAQLMEQTRQSKVAEKLKAQGSNIITSTTPAIRIEP